MTRFPIPFGRQVTAAACLGLGMAVARGVPDEWSLVVPLVAIGTWLAVSNAIGIRLETRAEKIRRLTEDERRRR